MFKALTTTLIAVALMALTMAPAPARAESVLTVVAIDTNGNTAEYLKRLKTTLDLAKAAAPDATWRVWAATYSGDSVGTIYVTAEYSSQAALAAADAASATDEFAASIAALREMGSVVVSRSILSDVTPE